MKWVSKIYKSNSLSAIFESLADDMRASFGPMGADIGFLFVSWQLRKELVQKWKQLHPELPIKHIIGCTGGGVIGNGSEIEDQPAVSFIAAKLPKIEIKTFDLKQEDLPGLDGSPKPWRELIQVSIDSDPNFILLSDPFSLDADALVGGLDFAYPSAKKMGGLASGGQMPNSNILIHNDKVLSKGVVGVALSGPISFETIVAQGCRPIGKPFKITEAKDNILLTLENEPPLEVLAHLYEDLSEKDQELLQTSLFLGIVMDSFNKNPKQGDFLIRNIIGLDQDKGHLAIGALLRPGQIVQFHLRDASTSDHDLKNLLSEAKSGNLKTMASTSSGALMFSCLGRGENLYGDKDHDSNLVKDIIGKVPTGGFFCNGEIGPVGGKTYLHGYTSSIAFISELKKKRKKEPEKKEQPNDN